MESKCNAPNGMNTFISLLFILECLGLSTRWKRGVLGPDTVYYGRNMVNLYV